MGLILVGCNSGHSDNVSSTNYSVLSKTDLSSSESFESQNLGIHVTRSFKWKIINNTNKDLFAYSAGSDNADNFTGRVQASPNSETKSVVQGLHVFTNAATQGMELKIDDQLIGRLEMTTGSLKSFPNVAFDPFRGGFKVGWTNEHSSPYVISIRSIRQNANKLDPLDKEDFLIIEVYNKSDFNISNPSKWMANINDKMPLNSIIMPGSHDAGMSEAIDCSGVGFTDGYNTITQFKNVAAQLDAGVRFFDLRIPVTFAGPLGVTIDRNPGLRTFHGANVINEPNNFFAGGCFGEPFGDISKATVDFLKLNPSETIIFRIGHMIANKHEAAQLIGRIKQTEIFKQHMVLTLPNDTTLATTPLSKLRGKVIIVLQGSEFDSQLSNSEGLFRFDEVADNNASYIPEKNTFGVYDHYSGSDDIAHVARDQKSRLMIHGGLDKQYEFLLSWTATQDGAELVHGNLSELAEKMTFKFDHNEFVQLHKDNSNHLPHIVYLDYVNAYTSLNIINLNSLIKPPRSIGHIVLEKPIMKSGVYDIQKFTFTDENGKRYDYANCTVDKPHLINLEPGYKLIATNNKEQDGNVIISCDDSFNNVHAEAIVGVEKHLDKPFDVLASKTTLKSGLEEQKFKVLTYGEELGFAECTSNNPDLLKVEHVWGKNDYQMRTTFDRNASGKAIIHCFSKSLSLSSDLEINVDQGNTDIGSGIKITPSNNVLHGHGRAVQITAIDNGQNDVYPSCISSNPKQISVSMGAVSVIDPYSPYDKTVKITCTSKVNPKNTDSVNLDVQ